MVNRELAIAIAILVLVGIGFYLVSNMTGNVITGFATRSGEKMKINNEYYKISDFGDNVNKEEVENGESRSG